MHATIQKPINEIIGYLKPDERVFVVGCGNCAAKCHSGGEPETEEMAKRLADKGVKVAGWACPAPGVGICKLAVVKKLLNEDYAEQTKEADSYLILACGQGIHTVIDATEGGVVHPGCDTIFGGETVTDDFITEYCSLCGECLLENTGGLCPVTLCAKSLLNGPCGGAKDGKCEVDKDRDCGWQLIYDRLKELGTLGKMYEYIKPKNNTKWSRPRSISIGDGELTFRALGTDYTVSTKD
ncbi:MAG: methylenetetrahydrofolate reductase C-terminal domain-containing protein [Dehalococcoidales bacterium]|nr:methylenetetrahydrofolate reductase C-terminal domain-containing protein [Dehalococcoidales bacterium]